MVLRVGRVDSPIRQSGSLKMGSSSLVCAQGKKTQDPLAIDDSVGFEAYCSTPQPLLKSRSRLLTLSFVPLPLNSTEEKSRVKRLIAFF